MAFDLDTLKSQEAKLAAKFTLPRKLYKTADGSRVVEADDPDAAFVYGPAGRQVPLIEAIEYGLTDGAPEPEVEAPADPEPKAEAKPEPKKRASAKAKKE
jgi:hypothetical protein